MNDHILKQQWERYKEHVMLKHSEIKVIIAPVISDKISAIELLSEGCANTNYKIGFKSHQPVVLRIYTRESSSLAREYELHQMLEQEIPVTKYLFIDASQSTIDYPFAICSYVDGVLMRDIVLSGNEKAIRESCFDAGRHLASLSTIKFKQGGFFEQGLNVRSFKPEEEYFTYCMTMLTDKNIQRDLGKELLGKLHELIANNHKKYLPDLNDANLTHGDFDPANIKVLEINGVWQVTGILDWEFAFAGSYFLDIGMMLRFSHKLPHFYEDSFIEGLTKHGCSLPEHWKKSAKMMDLLCLLQLIYYNPRDNRPKLNLDVTGLIKNTVDNWSNF